MLATGDRKGDLGASVEEWAAREYDLPDPDPYHLIDFPDAAPPLEVKSCARWTCTAGQGRQGPRRRGRWKGTWDQLDYLREVGGMVLVVVYDLDQRATETRLDAIEERLDPILSKLVGPDEVERLAYSSRESARRYWTLPWTRVFRGGV